MELQVVAARSCPDCVGETHRWMDMAAASDQTEIRCPRNQRVVDLGEQFRERAGADSQNQAVEVALAAVERRGAAMSTQVGAMETVQVAA